MVVGRLPIAIEPFAKSVNGGFDFDNWNLGHGIGLAKPATPWLFLYDLEAIHRLESQDRLQDSPELGHLFFAVESHEFTRDWTRRSLQKCPTIAHS